MNLADLTRQTRRHLAEIGTGAHKDPDIVGELNRAASNYAAENSLLKGAAVLEPLDGVASVPDDLISIISVVSPQWRSTLTPVDPQDIALFGGLNLGYGMPTHYSFDPAWGRNLQVYPARSVTLSVIYRRAATEMVQPEDQPWEGIHAPYHDLIALKAAHQLQGQTGVSAAKDVVWIQRLAQREQEFKSYLALIALDNPPMRMATGPRRPRRYY